MDREEIVKWLDSIIDASEYNREIIAEWHIKEIKKSNELIVKQLNDLIEVQKNSCTDEYNRGLANGLICAKSVITKEDPKYVEIIKEQEEILSNLK